MAAAIAQAVWAMQVQAGVRNGRGGRGKGRNGPAGDSAPMAKADIDAWEVLVLDVRWSQLHRRGIPLSTPSRGHRWALRGAAIGRVAERKVAVAISAVGTVRARTSP